MPITSASTKNAKVIAEIISESNKDVAKKFNITRDNNPKHPSFCTKQWVLSDFKRGEEYFIYKEDNINKGCVAFEQPDHRTAYLNRLSVLPRYRHNKIGESLIDHIIKYSKSKKLEVVSIGIIASHGLLKSWYSGLGFMEISTQKFDHLPFDVTYMQYRL